MSQPTVEEVQEATRLALLSGFLPYLNAELDKMDRQTDMKAASAARNGNLTPEMATSMWHDKAATLRIRQHFNKGA